MATGYCMKCSTSVDMTNQTHSCGFIVLSKYEEAIWSLLANFGMTVGKAHVLANSIGATDSKRTTVEQYETWLLILLACVITVGIEDTEWEEAVETNDDPDSIYAPVGRRFTHEVEWELLQVRPAFKNEIMKSFGFCTLIEPFEAEYE